MRLPNIDGKGGNFFRISERAVREAFGRTLLCLSLQPLHAAKFREGIGECLLACGVSRLPPHCPSRSPQASARSFHFAVVQLPSSGISNVDITSRRDSACVDAGQDSGGHEYGVGRDAPISEHIAEISAHVGFRNLPTSPSKQLGSDVSFHVAIFPVERVHDLRVKKAERSRIRRASLMEERAAERKPNDFFAAQWGESMPRRIETKLSRQVLRLGIVVTRLIPVRCANLFEQHFDRIDVGSVHLDALPGPAIPAVKQFADSRNPDCFAFCPRRKPGKLCDSGWSLLARQLLNLGQHFWTAAGVTALTFAKFGHRYLCCSPVLRGPILHSKLRVRCYRRRRRDATRCDIDESYLTISGVQYPPPIPFQRGTRWAISKSFILYFYFKAHLFDALVQPEFKKRQNPKSTLLFLNLVLSENQLHQH